MECFPDDEALTEAVSFTEVRGLELSRGLMDELRLVEGDCERSGDLEVERDSRAERELDKEGLSLVDFLVLIE